MEKRALNIYHIVNVLHLLFYAYMAIQILNIANLRAMFIGNSKSILIAYISIAIILSLYAKNIGKGIKNPIHTVLYAKYLHHSAIAIFVVGVVGSMNLNPKILYLVFLSFPLDLAAFILAVRSTIIKPESSDDLLDNFDIDE